MLADELRHRLACSSGRVEVIAERAPERLPTGARPVTAERGSVDWTVGRVDEQRLAQELAFLADKLDITEELVRFGAHLKAARDALAGDAPVGSNSGFWPRSSAARSTPWAPKGTTRRSFSRSSR